MRASTPADKPPDQYIKDCLANGPWFRQMELPLDLNVIDPRATRDTHAMAERLVNMHGQTIVVVTTARGQELEWGVIDVAHPTYTILCYRMVTVWRPQLQLRVPAPGCVLYVTQDHIRRVL